MTNGEVRGCQKRNSIKGSGKFFLEKPHDVRSREVMASASSLLPPCVCVRGCMCSHVREKSNQIRYNINRNINHPRLRRERKILETSARRPDVTDRDHAVNRALNAANLRGSCLAEWKNESHGHKR